MKYIFITFTILLQSGFARLDNLDDSIDWSLMSENESEIFVLKESLKEKKFIIRQFQEVKLFILKGKIDGALERLEELNIKYNTDDIRRLIYFFQAKCYFILGDFDTANSLLESKLFTQNKYYENICYLKYLTSININTQSSILGINRCTRINIEDTDINSNWMRYVNDHILDNNEKNDYFRELVLKSKQFTTFKEVESWLKFGILYNYEDLIVKTLEFLPSMAILNDELRTLVAYNLYNDSKKSQAREYIEDINSSNALYLKSLIALKEKDYKVANAHLLTTLKTKNFSLNANQLTLAVSWLNEEYKNARLSLNKIIPMTDFKVYQYIFNTTLVYKERSYFRAQKEIDFLSDAYMENLPYEGNILATNVYLNNDNPKWIETSEDACKSFDMLNCWLRMQADIWDNYSEYYKKITNEKWVYRFNENLNKIMKKNDSVFEDSIFINQNDIEELDIQTDPSMGEVEY